MTRVLIIGAGLNAAKVLGGADGVDVTLIDRRNHHLFQPLLYRVAMAALSPADIAAPIRSILSHHSEYPSVARRCSIGRASPLGRQHHITHKADGRHDLEQLDIGKRQHSQNIFSA